MTNEEAIEVIKKMNNSCGICGRMLSVVCDDAKDIAIKSLQENTKLKDEIDELKSKIVSLNYENTDLKEEVGANILWSKCVEKTLKKEIDKNTKLCEEIAELKGETTMQVGLGGVDDRKIFSIRVSDNLMFETPLLCIGVDDVVEIKYHEPHGEGDKHFVDVLFESGATVRCFDIVNIQFGEKEKSE